jgi:hypothetical protein
MASQNEKFSAHPDQQARINVTKLANYKFGLEN